MTQDTVFPSCNCENCPGYYETETEYDEGGTPCGRTQIHCECDCHQKPEINQEEETCPQCGENIEYIKQLDWGHLYCTRCNWTERI